MTITTTHTDRDASVDKDKAQPGASWKDKEEQVLPKNRLGIVFFGLMCTLFLAALDQTIVATALPTIVTKLGGGNKYGWIGSAYMLAAGAIGPLYGKLSNMFGRKPILYSSILTFLFGSAMCGAAQNMTWLIVCRAIQGIGGGGVMQLVVITVSDIVPLKDRGRYSGFLGATYGIASVMGPFLGGVFAEHVSWRWCFFINLPTGGIAAATLFIFLNPNPHERRPIRELLAKFDFIGLVCFVGGIVCFLIGLDFSQAGWSEAKTIAPLVIGIFLLISGGINEMFTKRSPILPPRLFRTRTTGILLISGFFHAFVFFGASYYLPLYFQVLGSSATGAGIKILPFSLGGALMSIVSGQILSKIGKYRLIMWVAYSVGTLGMGLMTMLDYTSSSAEKEVFPLIATLGLGCLFQVPLVALQAAMPLKDMATASGGFMFLRTVGAAVGIAVGEAIVTSVLPQKLTHINLSSLGFGTSAAGLNENVGRIHLIPDASLRDAVMHAFSEAISTIWIVSTPTLGAMLILTLFLREYSLERKTVRSGDSKEPPGDVERGTTESESVHNEGHEMLKSLDDDLQSSTETVSTEANMGKVEASKTV